MTPNLSWALRSKRSKDKGKVMSAERSRLSSSAASSLKTVGHKGLWLFSHTYRLAELSLSHAFQLSLYFSVCLSVCISLTLSFYFSVCPSVCLFVSLSLSLFQCLSVCLSLSIYLCVYVFLSLCLCLYLSLTASLSLCICLFVCLSFCVSFCQSLSLPPYLHIIQWKGV